MRRNGKKILECASDHTEFYKREYECPRCGLTSVYSEIRDKIVSVTISDV